MAPNDGNLFIPLDVNYADDDRIIEAGEKAELLYIRSLGFMKRTLSDGYIAEVQLQRIGLPGISARVQSLLRVGLWVPAERGYNCPAYLKRNRSKAEIKETQRLEREAAALGNHRRWHGAKKNARCDYCVGRLVDPTNEKVTPPNPPPDRVPDPLPDLGGESTITSTRTETETRTQPKTRTRTRTGSKSSAPQASLPDDPVKVHARKLTQLAFEQLEKPVLRLNPGGNVFMAAMGVIETVLRSGTPLTDIERAILAGVEVWSIDGLRTSVAKTRPRNRSGGTDAVMAEIQREIGATA